MQAGWFGIAFAWSKDPDTGKRLSRANPQSEWHRADVPHLRIVDPDIFAEASGLKAERGRMAPAHRRKPKHMLSGLLRCGTCGGGLSVKGEDRGGTRIECTRSRDARTCENGRTYYLHHIERTVISGLQKHLKDPSAIKLFLKTYHDERKRLAADGAAAKQRLERQLGEVDPETQPRDGGHAFELGRRRKFHRRHQQP